MQESTANTISHSFEGNHTTKPKGRLLFVDNIRTYLTILVIAHHLMVIYAGSGGWVYHEGRQDEITSALGGWFCSVNQAYFMGLFLFVAAYFVPGAYDRKGPGKFLTDRLIRLGIPLASYSWILRPVLIFYAMHSSSGSFWQWYTGEYFRVYGWIGGGPLWFIEVLLLFSLIYVLWRLVKSSSTVTPVSDSGFPTHGTIALFALSLGVASFLVRVVSPVNKNFVPLNFQFANFSQYIAMFVLGLVAYRKNWLHTLPDRVGKRWFGVAFLIIILYGPLAVLGGATENAEPFLGGWNWQALLFALWDAFLCVSMCTGLVYFFQRYFNHQGTLSRELSRGAYATYLIHEPFISILAALTAGIMIYPLLKFVLASVVLIPLCFGLGSLVRRLPYFDRVL